jgi:formyltetrahydrofolate hydrolase
VLPHADYATRDAFDDALAKRIDALGVDLVVMAGFMRILGDRFVRRHEGRIVNIHPSLLPSFAGLHTHARAIAAGVRVHGATVHLVTPTLDHGPIVAQAAGDGPRRRRRPDACRARAGGRAPALSGRGALAGRGPGARDRRSRPGRWRAGTARLLWEPAR